MNSVNGFILRSLKIFNSTPSILGIVIVLVVYQIPVNDQLQLIYRDVTPEAFIFECIVLESSCLVFYRRYIVICIVFYKRTIWLNQPMVFVLVSVWTTRSYTRGNSTVSHFWFLAWTIRGTTPGPVQSGSGQVSRATRRFDLHGFCHTPAATGKC